MMDGITVLAENTYKVMGKIPFIILFMSLIIGIIGFLLIEDCREELGCIFIIIAIILISFSIYSWDKEILGGYKETTYKVTISDKVNFKEFNKKYEVVEQDGQIYEIKEKDK